MPSYIVGKTWTFKEHSRTFHAGEPIELDEAVADEYMRNEHGLLKPARTTTQATVSTVRTPKARVTRSRK